MGSRGWKRQVRVQRAMVRRVQAKHPEPFNRMFWSHFGPMLLDAVVARFPSKPLNRREKPFLSVCLGARR